MNEALQYAEQHFDDYLENLTRCLRIPSVSSQPRYTPHMDRCARWLVDHLHKMGIRMAEAVPTVGHPVVFGWHQVADERPTLLVYGHYDVQPPGPESDWESAPFSPEVRQGAIYARGASDNKGQLFIILSAVQSWLQGHGQLPLNLKIVLEGDEETSPASMADFAARYTEALQADAALVCDTVMAGPEVPALTISLRGIVALQAELTGPSRNLHSGEYGGAAPNPLTELCRLMASLHDGQGRIAVEGFYEDVEELSPTERRRLAALPFDCGAWLSSVGLKDARTEPGYSILESTTVRPCLDIHGIWGGHAEPGLSTIIAPLAGAKLSARLVARQTAAEAESILRRHLERQALKALSLNVQTLGLADPVAVDPAGTAVQAARRAMQETFRRDPAFIREGGSIPAVGILHEQLGIELVLAGFALLTDGAHAPNEHFGLDRFRLGVQTLIRFLAHLSDA